MSHNVNNVVVLFVEAPQGKASAGKMKKKLMLFNLNGIRVWTQSDKNAPFFPEDSYEIAKSIQLTVSITFHLSCNRQLVVVIM